MSHEDKIEARVAELLREAKTAVAFTGAGVSTPSGIPDFRSPSSGLWETVDPFEVASIIGFRKNPSAFYEWVYPVAELILKAQPNPAHIALAKLESAGYLQGVITQNIDLLHRRAGSQMVCEVHGSLQQATCWQCGTVHDVQPMLKKFLENRMMPRCTVCHQIIKPDVVLFGEDLPMDVWRAAEMLIDRADLVLVIGSSLEVYPAAGLPFKAVKNRAKLIIIDKETTPADDHAAVVIHDDVAHVLPRVMTFLEAK
ncbi:MAG: NAD-dependent deacylase [Chloroflexi bacterium]|nr:MAG: hypothetical protein CUN54_00405 [Phototrophicales bacterium]RMF79317.1 MAG: NAD-dependent deacylase [Chloroflexota bacterium]